MADFHATRALIQARMTSRRFPGKMLAPFRGQPLIGRVIDRVAAGFPRDQIVLVTSTDPADDPLALYVESLGMAVFRGPLENVLKRFQLCVQKMPCDWFFRVSGDSPFYDAGLLAAFMAIKEHSAADLITNVFPRTFPPGHSTELLRADTFLQVDAESATPDEQEHITNAYYNHPGAYRIVNIGSGDAGLTSLNLTVDTPDDLHRLETFVEDTLPDYRITHAA